MAAHRRWEPSEDAARRANGFPAANGVVSVTIYPAEQPRFPAEQPRFGFGHLEDAYALGLRQGRRR